MPIRASLLALASLLSIACAPVETPADAGPPVEDEPQGELFVVAGETTSGFSDGAGRAARFAGITCMELSADGSTLYLSDTFNGTVRALDVESAQVSTLAGAAQQLSTSDGTGDEARFAGPRGLGLSPDGSTLFVADGPTIRRVDLASGSVALAVGLPSEDGYVDGSALEARLGYLMHDLAVSADGATVFIADRSNDTIRAMDVASEAVSTLAGGGAPGADGVATEAGFDGPGGLALDDGVLYVADTFSHTLRALALDDASVSTVAGRRGASGTSDGPLETATLSGPQGLAVLEGALYATGFDGLLRRVDLAEDEISTPVGAAGDARALDGPAASARLGGAFAPPVADRARGRLYYADLDAGSVRVIDVGDGSVATLAGPVAPVGFVDGSLEEARFSRLFGVAASRDGERVYLADTDNGAVRLVERGGDRVSTLATGELTAPVSLALDEAGDRLFISDAGAGRVFVLPLQGGELSPLTEAAFNVPWGLAYDGAGALYVADYGAHLVHRVDVGTGEVELLAGSGAPGSADGTGPEASFRGPLGLAYDEEGARLAVTDFEGHTVRLIDVDNGAVLTLSGQGGEAGFRDGDDARFDGPSGVSVSGGAIYVADALNHVVRRVDLATGETSTALGNPNRPGAPGFGLRVPQAEATLLEPEALVVSEAGLHLVAGYALYLLAAGEPE